MGRVAAETAARSANNPTFFMSVAVATGGGIAFSPGGVLVRRSGVIIGAVEISGGTGEVDEAWAKDRIAAAIGQIS